MQLSVIITTYNRPDALARVMESLAAQTHPPNEVIIADDGSGEQTRMLIEARQRHSLFPLRHVWQPDEGFRAARIRNRAILRSSGDYLVLLDGDCIPTLNFINDHRRLMQPGCFFQGKRVLVGRDLSASFSLKTMQQGLWRHALRGSLGNWHHLLRLPWLPAYTTRRHTGIRTCNMGVFRRDMFAVNGFNEDFRGWGREDSELAVRLYKYGLKRKENPFGAICFHLWHAEQDRSRLTLNDDLLEKSLVAPHYACTNGLNTP